MVEKTEVQIMLDSGSSVSLIQESIGTGLATAKAPSPVGLTSVPAAEDISVLGCITVTLGVGTLQVTHPLIINSSVIDRPNIHAEAWLDFTSSMVKIIHVWIRSHVLKM